MLGKIDEPLRWHQHNVILNIFVFKEDQKSQIFLQLTVLLCNIGRSWYFSNWYVSKIFNWKTFMFSLEKALREHSNVIFFGRNSFDERKGNMIFSYWWLPSGNIITKWYYFKASNFQKYLCYLLFLITNFCNVIKKLCNFHS